jgi:flagellar motor protein MotB
MKYQRTNKAAQAAHADDWLMTYADMITLLLCFFAVFLSVSISQKAPVQKALAVQAAPPPPIVAQAPVQFITSSTFRISDMPPADEDQPDEKPQTEQPKPAIVAAAQPSAAKEEPAQVQAETVVAAKPAEARTADTPQYSFLISLPTQAIDPKPPKPAAVEQNGDRITSIEISSAAFFDSGSATLRPDGEVILRNVATQLKADKFRDYNITVEGHTDDQPIQTLQFPSNWELSTARASAVVHFFLSEGLSAQKLSAAGYADTFPKLPNRDANGNSIPENQAQNRRVVIKLEKIVKTEAPIPLKANDQVNAE